MIVRELLTRLGWIVDTDGSRRYEDSLNDVGRRAANVTGILQGMMAAAAAAFSVSSIARTIDQVVSLEGRIAQLPQTIGSSGDAFNYLTDKANAARQPIQAYMSLYTRIGHAAKDLLPTQESLSGVIDTISQSFVLGGQSANEQASAMLQLSQAFNKGKLDGDEFKSAMENMPGQVTQSLAEAMGYLTKGDLMKASSDGKLTIDKLVAGFKSIAPEIEKAFLKMPLTIGQATAIASNKWARFLAKMNRESGAVTWILGKFNALVDGLEKFGDASVKFFGSSTNAVKALGLAITSVLLPSIVKLSASMLAFLASPTGLLLAGLVGIALVAEDIYQWTQDNESLIGRVAPKFKDWSESVKRDWQATKKVFTDLFSYIEGRIDYIVNAMANMIPDWLKDAVSGGAEWVSETTTVINQAGSKNPNLVYGESSSWRAGAAAGTAADTLYGGARGGDVKIENLNVTVSNSNASAKDIATETSKAISSRQRVNSMSAMGAKS